MYRIFWSGFKFVGVEHPFSTKSPDHHIAQLMNEGCDGSQHQLCVDFVFVNPATAEVSGVVHNNSTHMSLGSCDGSCALGLKIGELLVGPEGWGFF